MMIPGKHEFPTSAAVMAALAAVAVVMSATVMAPAVAHAEGPKIGVVITQRLLTQTEAGKGAAEKLQEKKKAAQSKLDSKAKEMQEMQEDLAKRAMVLSESERQKAAEDFDRKQRDAARMKEDLERELQKIEAEVLGGVNRFLTGVVVEYGKANGYDIVIDATATLYFSDAADITDALIKEANASYKK